MKKIRRELSYYYCCFSFRLSVLCGLSNVVKYEENDDVTIFDTKNEREKEKAI